jgi:hypothetical protein
MIDGEDLGLFQFANDPESALRILQSELERAPAEDMPADRAIANDPIPYD